MILPSYARNLPNSSHILLREFEYISSVLSHARLMSVGRQGDQPPP